MTTHEQTKADGTPVKAKLKILDVKFAPKSNPGIAVGRTMQLPSKRRGSAYFLVLALYLMAGFTPACKRQLPLIPYTAYVVNQQSATLVAVNLADFRVTTALSVAPRPEHVLVRPGTRQLYVVSPNGKISVAEFPRLRALTTLDVGRSATDLAFSADGLSAYVLDPIDHELVFLDCRSAPTRLADAAVLKAAFRLRLAGTLHRLVLSPDGKTLAADSENPDQITLISTETRLPLGTIQVGRSPGPLVILPDNSKIFVADTGEEKISVAGLSSQKLFSHIEIGTRPTAMLLKLDGGEIFVLSATSSTMVILDAFHDNVEQVFPLGSNPVTGIFRKDMSVLFIADAGGGSVLALDVQHRMVLASTHVGMEPSALALTPDQRLLVAVDRAASSLAILHADEASLNNDRSVLITTVPVGGSPVDVAIPDFASSNR